VPYYYMGLLLKYKFLALIIYLFHNITAKRPLENTNTE